MIRELTVNEAVVEEATAEETEVENYSVPLGLQVLKAQVSTNTRHELLEGRNYLVVPMVMITEGVHAGSNGPLFYPRAELSKTPVVWNHKPIVVYHPMHNGSAISACEPAVISSRKVGLIMNTRFKPGTKGEPGKLSAEAWLEVNRLKTVDQRVLDAINKGEMVEVSTGLFTDNEQTNGTWKGKTYTAVAKNYRPDHLAILPDEVGACSIKDGAGLMRNAKVSHDEIRSQINVALQPKTPGVGVDSPWVQDVYDTFCVYQKGKKYYAQDYSFDKAGKVVLGGSPKEVLKKQTYRTLDGTILNVQGVDGMDKSKMIDTLIANVATGWDESDREFLEGCDETVLQKMLPTANAQAVCTDGKKDDNSEQVTGAAGQVKAKKGGSKVGGVDNKGKVPFPPEEEEEEEPEEEVKGKGKGKSTMNQAVPTLEEYVANAPEGVREVLITGVRQVAREKERLVRAITANKRCRFSAEYLMGKGIEELQALAELGQSDQEKRAPVANFLGLSEVSSPVQNVTEDEEEPLMVPTMNFRKVDD